MKKWNHKIHTCQKYCNVTVKLSEWNELFFSKLCTQHMYRCSNDTHFTLLLHRKQRRDWLSCTWPPGTASIIVCVLVMNNTVAVILHHRVYCIICEPKQRLDTWRVNRPSTYRVCRNLDGANGTSLRTKHEITIP